MKKKSRIIKIIIFILAVLLCFILRKFIPVKANENNVKDNITQSDIDNSEQKAKMMEQMMRQKRSKEAEELAIQIKNKSQLTSGYKTFKRYFVCETKHDNSISKWLWKDTLKLCLTYEVRYFVNLENLSIEAKDGKVYIHLTKSDFELNVNNTDVIKIDATGNEKGVFPEGFTNDEVIAAEKADRQDVIEEYSNDNNYLQQCSKEIENCIINFSKKLNPDIEIIFINDIMEEENEKE